MNASTARLTALATALFLGGCGAYERAYPGHNPESVWTAMVAVATTPDYSDMDPSRQWMVHENNVWADAETSRIEIHRLLRRDLHLPRQRKRREDREWRFQVRLDQSTPPTISFDVRQWTVPAHAWEEADRYFNDVAELLAAGGPRPGPSETDDETEPTDEPPVDVIEPEEPDVAGDDDIDHGGVR